MPRVERIKSIVLPYKRPVVVSDVEELHRWLHDEVESLGWSGTVLVIDWRNNVVLGMWKVEGMTFGAEFTYAEFMRLVRKYEEYEELGIVKFRDRYDKYTYAFVMSTSAVGTGGVHIYEKEGDTLRYVATKFVL